MRFRLGVTVGFGVGYYLGAKAGRERYEQLHTCVEKFRHSGVYESAADGKVARVQVTIFGDNTTTELTTSAPRCPRSP